MKHKIFLNEKFHKEMENCYYNMYIHIHKIKYNILQFHIKKYYDRNPSKNLSLPTNLETEVDKQ